MLAGQSSSYGSYYTFNLFRNLNTQIPIPVTPASMTKSMVKLTK